MNLTERDVNRFWSRVVRGPGDRDCWIWIGAIADDGYGRFWVKTDGRARVLRPHRVAFALATSTDVDDHAVVEHVVCDNPICVRAIGDRFDHLAGGTQHSNLDRMAARGRGGGRPLLVRVDNPGRAELAARSLALRAAVRDGWDPEKIQHALTPKAGTQAGLWTI